MQDSSPQYYIHINNMFGHLSDLAIIPAYTLDKESQDGPELTGVSQSYPRELQKLDVLDWFELQVLKTQPWTSLV